MATLVKRPASSLPQAMADGADLKAADRFFDNSRQDPWLRTGVPP